MNKISRLWALVITIAVLALGAVVANSNSPSSAEGGCAGQVCVGKADIFIMDASGANQIQLPVSIP